jgi:hypothetical protein
VRRNIFKYFAVLPTVGARFTMLPILACGAGIYIGLHFNILALLPFSILAAGAYLFASWGSGLNFLDSASFLFLPMFAVQAGYMLGLTGRDIYGQLLERLKIGQSERI